MSTSEPTVRRRFTVIELGVILLIAGLFAAIAVPVLLDESEDPALLDDLRTVQNAVRRYHAETSAYPSYPPPDSAERPAVNPWSAGGLPGVDSAPRFAGLDFGAEAFREADRERVRFRPNYVEERPRHSGEFADDSTRRWRIDAQGNVSIELGGRSY